jgi:hypothetical protein
MIWLGVRGRGGLALLLLLISVLVTGGHAVNAQGDLRLFQETGFRVFNDSVWDYFSNNGAVETFGFPVSRTFRLLGCNVQIFQRLVVQVCDGQAPAIMNLLDPEIFPYTQVNGSLFPGPDDALKASTPRVGTPEYAGILDFVRASAPDDFNGQPVGFGATFLRTGGLGIWGTPISRPMTDPNNASFVYQRFQRGIMHYVGGEGTHGLLLADTLKAIMLGPERAGIGLPGDLAAQAGGSPFFAQYCPGEDRWLCRPGDLIATDLTGAFQPGTDPIAGRDEPTVSQPTATPMPLSTPTDTPTPRPEATPIATPTETLLPTQRPTRTPTATSVPTSTPTPPVVEIPTPPATPTAVPTSIPSPTAPVVILPTVPPSPTAPVISAPTVPATATPTPTATISLIINPIIKLWTPTPPTLPTPQPKP